MRRAERNPDLSDEVEAFVFRLRYAALNTTLLFFFLLHLVYFSEERNKTADTPEQNSYKRKPRCCFKLIINPLSGKIKNNDGKRKLYS